MSSFVVRKSIRIRAGATDVWDALTDPQKTKKYFFHCEVFSSWKEGDSITFKGKMFLIINIEMKGKILKVIPEKLLQYTLENKHGEEQSFSTVTDELTEKDGETVLSVSDEVGQGPGAEKRYKKSQRGWDKILKGLKEFVEKSE
jgi:uncharacterized protein YndB with AHSA1/START domain